MSRSASAINAGATEATWRSLEHQLDELLRLTQTASSVAEFHVALLSRAAQAVGARLAMLWVTRATGHVILHSASESIDVAADSSWQLDTLWGADRNEYFPDGENGINARASSLEQRLGNDSDAGVRFVAEGSGGSQPTAAVAAIRVDGQTFAALELVWLAPVSTSMQRNIANIITAFAEVAAGYYSHRQLRELQRQIDNDLTLDRFSLAVQRLPDERTLWFTIVNELGRLIPCDRVSLLTRRGGWRVRTVSHIDSVDRRSAVVRSLERLASALHDPQPTWLQSTSHADDMPAGPRWHDYLEESSARSVAFIPLQDRGDPAADGIVNEIIGALVMERFVEQPFASREQQQIERLARHTAAALGRVADLRRRSILSKIRNKATLFGAFIAASVLGAAFIPVDFEITARGELQPVSRQQVFAPADGLVRQLHVQAGQEVAAGAILLELSNDQLDFEITRLSGELQTARQQWLTVQAARLEAAPPPPARDQRGQLAAEEERLKQVIRGLEQQYEHLLQQREDLKVRSPIAGRVVTANLEQVLRSRPLRRGQRLLTIADDSGPWVLELQVEDQDAGHILAATKAGAPLPLRFVVATQPTISHHGTVAEIAQWTELNEASQPSVRITATIENSAGLAARPGATATAKVFCGRKQLGYVWLRDLIELVRTRVLF